MIKHLQKRPFARLLFLWITGTLFQYYLPGVFPYSYCLLLPAAAGMLYSFFPVQYRIYNDRWVWGAGFSFLIIFIAMQFTYYHAKHSEWNLPEGIASVKGIVLENPQQKPRSVYVPVKISTFINKDTAFPVTKTIQVYLQKDTVNQQLQPGDRFLLSGIFRPVEQPYLRLKGFSASVYAASGHIKKEPENENTIPISLRILQLRNKLLGRYDSLSCTVEEKAVVSAITLGYTNDMGKELRQRFSATGVSHILSVSGFHVAIVCMFVSLLLAILPVRYDSVRILKYLITVMVLWLFALLTGMSAPAVRAALMLTFFLSGSLLRRYTDGYNIMAASAFFMLVYNPFFLFDIGFQLSYIAVFSIIYLQPRLNSLIKVRNPLLAKPWSWVTVTVAAQIGTLPLCLYIFGMFSTVFILTNIPLVVIAMFLIPVMLIWLMCMPYLPEGNLLQLLSEKLIHWMMLIVNDFNALSGASLLFRFDYPEMLLSYGTMIFLLMYLERKKPKLLLTSLSLLLIILLLAAGRKIM